MNDSDLCPACNKPLAREDTCRIVGGHILHARCRDAVPAARDTIYGLHDLQLQREIQSRVNRRVEALGAEMDKLEEAHCQQLRTMIEEAQKPSRDPLRVSISNDGTRYTLLDDVVFVDDKLGRVVIRDGFVTDFASTPKWLWLVYPPTGFYQRAALLHDYLYQHGARLHLLTRAECDWIFREQMKRDGVGIRTRLTMWAAVRLFGGRHWRGA